MKLANMAHIGIKKKFALSLVVLAGLLTSCVSRKSVVPPIIQGAHAEGGWWGACPPSNQTEADSIKIMQKLALSPEFSERLSNDFPPGSSAQTMADSLQSQGFRDGGSCKSDPSIKLATFYAKGAGLLPYATIAAAYWHTDGDRIMWTKGFVMYSGL